MIKVYLKAKTFDELIIKQQMMSTLAGAKFRYNESYYAKGEFYVTYEETRVDRWMRLSKEIDKRVKEAKAKNKADKK